MHAPVPDRPTFRPAHRSIRIVASLAALAALSAYRFVVTNGDFRNSDDAANFLAGVDLSQGNLRLHGWVMTPENYYPTDVLGEGVLKLLFGWHPLLMLGLESLIWAAVALVGTGLACAGQRPRHLVGVSSIALALLAFNVFEHGFRDVVVANIGSHGSTILLTLLTFAVAASGRRRGRAAILGLLMTLGSFSDRIYVVIACLPVLAEAVLGLKRRDARPALVRIAVTVGSFALAHALLALNASTGGFRLTSFPISLATFPEFLGHVDFAAESLIRLLGADFFGRPLRGSQHEAALITLLRTPLVLMFLIAWWETGAGVLRRAQRWPLAAGPRRHADLDHLLWLAVSSCVASTCVTNAIVDEACLRYFLPAAVAGSILVARRFGRLNLTAVFGTFALLASLIAGISLRSLDHPGRVVTIKQLYQIADVLRAAHLEHGYAGYWEGPIITVLSHRRITSLSVNEGADHRLHPLVYFSNADWYRTAARTWSGRVFFISERTDRPSILVAPEAAVIRQFGQPVQRVDLGQFVINVYDLAPGALRGLEPDSP